MDSLHVQIEAMKLALADAYRYFADPSSMEVTAEHLLNEDTSSNAPKLSI